MRQHCIEQARSISCAAEGRLEVSGTQKHRLGGVGDQQRLEEIDELGGVVGEIGLRVADGAVAQRHEIDCAVVVLEGGRIKG